MFISNWPLGSEARAEPKAPFWVYLFTGSKKAGCRPALFSF